MIAVEPQVYLAAHRFGVVAAAGGRKVRVERPDNLEAYPVTGGNSHAQVTEFAADGRVLARKVDACGRVECWLVDDLVQPARDALERERADFDRARDQLRHISAAKDAREAAKWGVTVEEYRRDRQRFKTLPPAMSSEFYHACARHHQRTGRLWDHTARGDRLRGQLVRDLGRAVEAERAAAERDGSN